MYFNGTAISAFIVPGSLVLAENLDLNLNELESVTAFLAHLYGIVMNLQLLLSNYHCILVSYTLAVQHEDVLHHLFV